jgi:methylamine dehydrogenase accessory protein MauD
MKKSTIIALFSLQVLILVGVATTAYFTFMNKARIRATQRVMVDTQEQLSSTFAFMDKIDGQQKKTEEAKKPLAEGIAAPTFTLQDENKQEIKLADYKGKKTLLVFSQESCGYCQKFYPVLNEFVAQKEDVNVVIMQIGSTPEQNKKYKAQQGIKSTLLAATQNELMNYKVQVTPTSVLLDKEGKVIGSKTISQLEELLNFVDQPIADASSSFEEKG